MAHPHAAERAPHVARAHKMMDRCGYARGGSVHDDAAEDARMIERGVHEHEAHDHPGKPKTKLRLGDGVEGEKGRTHLAKRARGGATHGKKKGHSTKVNIVIAPQGGGGGAPGMPAAMPPRPAMPPPAPPPGGMMPPGGPPRPPMPMPPGGAMGPPGAGMIRARGGKVVREEAGAMSGIGRIDKVHEYGSGRGFTPKKIPMAARGR